MPKAIVTIQVQGMRRRHELATGELTSIGRDPDCAIQVRDQSVSRQHCVAVFTGSKVCVNDLASTHGLLHDGERVGRCELEPGGSLQFGGATLVFERIEGAEATASAAAPTPPAKPALRQEAKPAPKPEPQPAPAPAAPPPAAAPAAQPVREIAGYRIFEAIGAGGYGTVYRAEQVRLSREVALKVLRLDEADGDRAARIEAFRKEAQAAAALNHPNLVQIFDVGHDGDTHYLAMELVAGGSLARRIKRDGPLPWRDVLDLLRDVAEALAAAHQSGLVHRDVKPANILLTADGQAKLTDLGLATGLAEAGTLAFMAPEQILRRPVDARADLYALGCTAYAALTGQAPFAGEKNEIARAHVKDAPPGLQQHGVRAPYHLEQLIVDSLLAKDPADRPQSAADLLDRLDRLLLPDSEPRNTAPRPKTDKAARIRIAAAGNSPKARMARFVSELVIFTMVGLVVIALLLAMKVISPALDIYRLIGK